MKKTGIASLAAVIALGLASTASAHDRPAQGLHGDLLMGRLVDILQAGRAAGRFNAPLPEDCVPHDCVAHLLDTATADDLRWLDEAPEADLPSRQFGRVPGTLVYGFMDGLIDLLLAETLAPEYAATAVRLETLLEAWKP